MKCFIVPKKVLKPYACTENLKNNLAKSIELTKKLSERPSYLDKTYRTG
jgi:hypothetical protein